MGCQRAQLEESRLNAQLADLVVIVLSIKNVPLLRALEDDLALRRDLQPRCCIDSRFLVEQRLKSLARFLANGIPVLVKTDLINLGQSVGHRVGQLVEFVAADPHSTALYFFASSVFTFLNISAYCAPLLRISSE